MDPFYWFGNISNTVRNAWDRVRRTIFRNVPTQEEHQEARRAQVEERRYAQRERRREQEEEPSPSFAQSLLGWFRSRFHGQDQTVREEREQAQDMYAPPTQQPRLADIEPPPAQRRRTQTLVLAVPPALQPRRVARVVGVPVAPPPPPPPTLIYPEAVEMLRTRGLAYAIKATRDPSLEGAASFQESRIGNGYIFIARFRSETLNLGIFIRRLIALTLSAIQCIVDLRGENDRAFDLFASLVHGSHSILYWRSVGSYDKRQNDNLQAMIILDNVVREAAGSIAFEDHGSEDGSAWTIRDVAAAQTDFVLTIYCNRRVNVQGGTALTGKLEQQIKEAYKGRLVIVPRNTDTGCFYYALGAAILYYKSKIRNMQIREPFVPTVIDGIINAHATEVPVCKRLFDLGRQQGMEHKFMSIDEGEEFFRTVQEMIGPEFVLRVLQLELKSNGQYVTYPLYYPKREGKQIINLVNFVSGEGAHFICPISQDQPLGTGGRKHFCVCRRCEKVFFSNKPPKGHKCDAVGEYAWSRKDVGQFRRAVGQCDRCRVKFDTEDALEYHTDPKLGGCFKSGSRGYSKVLLSEKSHLLQVDREEEDDALQVDGEDDESAFADFESCIDPETGEHSLLRWGVYVPDKYEQGDEITGFLDKMFEWANARDNHKLVVWFHNGSGYDFLYIFSALLNLDRYQGYKIGGILKGVNKWQRLVVSKTQSGHTVKVVFQDTYQFLTMSLEKLVECAKQMSTSRTMFIPFYEKLAQRYNKGVIDVRGPTSPVTAHFHEIKEELTRKNSLPYTYFTDPSVCKRPIADILGKLPDRQQDVARWLGFKKVGQWLDLYLFTDVLLLYCVFKDARNRLHRTHGVWLDKYVGMPATTWNAWLKFLAADPEEERPIIPLYSNLTQALFFKRMTRGGVTCASRRYAESDETHTILYLDVNGLYPHAMREPYPAGELHEKVYKLQGTDAEAKVKALFELWETRGGGGALELDLEVPDESHDYFKDFPPAPEHRVLQHDMREGNEYIERFERDHPGERTEFRGLVGTLLPKKHYGVHWRLLQWYLKRGLKVTALHRVISWTQEQRYLKGYVERNIHLRNVCQDALSKALYKMMGNALYGKTFENPFNHTGVRVVRDPVHLSGLIREGSVHSILYQGQHGTLVRLEGEEVVMDKPTYIGACVTEYAKLHMYHVFYDLLVDKVFTRDKIELLYTDTDSIIVRIEHEPGLVTPEEGCVKLIERINERAGETLIGELGGQMKSETGKDYIQQFVALRSKMYAYVTAGGKREQRAKGTTKEAQRELSFELYCEVLRGCGVKEVPNCRIARTGFRLQNVEQMRRALSANDGKRWISADGNTTLPFGHYSLRK